MEKIPPVIARTRLDDVRLTVSDRTAVDGLLDALADQVELTVQQAYDVLFPERTAAAATKALERLVKQVNTSAEQDGVDLRLEVSGAKKLGPGGRVLGFVAERVEQAGDPLLEHEAVRDNLIKDRSARLIGPRRIVLSHAAQDDKQASQLWDLVTDALDFDESRFVVWRADRDVLAGDDPGHQFRKAVAESDVAIVALSNSWLRQSEIRAAVLRQAEATGLKIVPVLLRPLSPLADLTGFGPAIYPDAVQGKPFTAVRGDAARSEWAHGLVDQVHRLLSRAGGRTFDMGLRDRRVLKADCGDGFFTLHGRPGSMEPDTPPERGPDGRRVEDVVSFLLKWAREADSSPLAALLGEYGAGKTITCQELTERLRAEPVPGQPEPLYFDLRKIGNLDRGVPVLADILTECINHGWAPGDAPLPTGEEVIARARKSRTLFVIDGLDEVLVRLDAAQGVAFTHELLKLRPIRTRDGVKAPFAGKDTKVLLSCRTHYFRSLREQSRHFLEHDRGLTTAEDYTALILLPLTDEQIHGYLDKTLPDRDASQVMDMLRAVHDLSDLATRPYTLAKVAAQIPFIERRLAERRSVHAATIYQQVLHDWLARDRGKHRLRPDHKLTLMARLAAWSWKRGDRRVDSTDLDDWLDEQLATDEVLHRRYATISRDELEEDLRTATFVVRSDANGPDRPDFQFAHTSIHEYFLAQHLCDALREDRRDEWCLPMPSDETLDFLGQLIADDDDTAVLTARLGSWRAPHVAEASELWLRYILRAREHNWPHVSIAGADLTGASLRDWQFSGSETNPLVLTSVTLSKADLRDTRWDHVTLSRANLDGARLNRSTFHRTGFSGTSLRGADLTGAFLHECRLNDTDLDQAITTGLRHVGSGTILPAPPQPAHTSLRSLGGNGLAADDIAFSPDGWKFAIASGDGAVRIRDVITGECLLILDQTDGWTVVFNADGSRLAAPGADHTVHVWDSATGEQLLSLDHAGPVSTVVFDPDGSQLATVGGSTTRWWDSVTGERLRTVNHTDTVRWVTYSPDSSRFATIGDDGLAAVWETATGEQLLSLDHAGPVSTVVFNPDGSQLATTSDKRTRLWDGATGEQLLSLDHVDPVHTAAFSPDGSQLATTDRTGRVGLWDSTTGEPLLVDAKHLTSIQTVVFAPNGLKFATVDHNGTATVWDSGTGEQLLAFTDRGMASVLGVALAPDGTRLATADSDGTTSVWNIATGEQLLALTGHTASTRQAVFSPEGSRLATASNDGTARLWDAGTGQHLLTLTGHNSTVWGLAFSPDGSRLATAGDDQTARVWDSTTGQHLLTLTGHAKADGLSGVNGVAFSPDGSRLATAGDDRTARVWDSTTGQHLLTLTGHTGWLWTTAFSPDGSRLVTASSDESVRVWDSETGEQLLTLNGHTAVVNTAVFSPDGSQLATASDDGTARLWDADTGEHLLTLTSSTGSVEAAVFSPDGSHLITCGDAGTAEVWNIAGQHQTWQAIRLPDDEAVSWSPADNRLLFTTPGAWRYLRAACFDEQGRMIGLQPHEWYYSLPPSQDE